MSCTTFFGGTTLVHRLDPRPRIVGTLLFAVVVACSARYEVLLAGVAIGIILAAASRLPGRPLLRRLRRINVFMAVLFLLVPPTTPGRALFTLGGLPFSAAGFHLAAHVTLKANAIVLVFTSLIGTIELTALGRAFHQLRLPVNLTHLLAFSLRYLDVLHHEYLTLRRAMQARAFRPRTTLHTYRCYGYLAGMLLVRSLERSERIMAAMKCRGFRGEFVPLRRFALARRDWWFGALALALLVVLAGAEWIGRGGLHP